MGASQSHSKADSITTTNDILTQPSPLQKSPTTADIRGYLQHLKGLFATQLRQSGFSAMAQKIDENSIRWSEIMEVTEKRDEFLAKYSTFRQQFVDELLVLVARFEKCAKCSAYSVGSITSTSDYDITVFGPRASIIVEQFNDLFNDIWGVESGLIFDTNLYGTGYFQPLVLTNFSCFMTNDASKNERCPPRDKLFVFVGQHSPGDTKAQHTWALMKMVYYLEPWLSANPDVPISLPDRTILERAKQRNADLLDGRSFGDIAYMNRSYEKALKHVDLVRTLYRTASQEQDVFSKGAQYKNAIAQANFFGNETYFTQGAFFHVVGEMQSHYSIQITPDELLDSAIENFADVLKETQHYKDIDSFLTHSSKYLQRFFDALFRHYGDTLWSDLSELFIAFKAYRGVEGEHGTELKKLRKRVLERYGEASDHKTPSLASVADFVSGLSDLLATFVEDVAPELI